MELIVRTRENPNPTERYNGRLWRNVIKACRDGGIIFNAPKVPVLENIDAAILKAVEVEGHTLEMDRWHDGDDGWFRYEEKPPLCGTTHCRAGWAIHLCGKEGYALEKKISTSKNGEGYEGDGHPGDAGALIYAASDPDAVVPDFIPSDIRHRTGDYHSPVEDFVMADLRERAARQLAASKGEGDE